MRFVFLVPDIDCSATWQWFHSFVKRFSIVQPLEDWARLRLVRTHEVYGGTLNIMRHCATVRSCGVEAVLASIQGRDTYQERGFGLPIIRWRDRRPDDICLVPDFVSELIDEVEGPAIAYLQVPIHTHNNFNYQHPRVSLWTDSPHMQSICQATFPNKTINIVPNIIDDKMFPFIPQSERESGVLFTFPRKGREFIAETQSQYALLGGSYWKFELIDGLSIHELAKAFSRPQVFLASAPIEGCALPPQESMASGIVVVGRTASGANFCMEHGKTAMVAETPAEAAKYLIELENAELRDQLSRNAYDYISRYFPSQEPTQFWQQTIRSFQQPLHPSNACNSKSIEFA
jgi:Glycosyl transferases group 1